MADYNGAYTNAIETLPGMDLTTVTWLACDVAIICTAARMGGFLESLIKPSSLLIVTGTASISDRKNSRQSETPPNNQVSYVE